MCVVCVCVGGWVGGWVGVCVSPTNIARHIGGKDVVIGEVWPVIKSAIFESRNHTLCDSTFFCSEAVTLLSVNVVV